jgi:hypothetical protein
MRLVPLQQWICDTCGDLIDLTSEDEDQREEAVYFEWNTVRVDGETMRHTGFHIVHHAPRAPGVAWGACQYPDASAYLGLTTLLGADGLIYLLAVLDEQSD